MQGIYDYFIMILRKAMHALDIGEDLFSLHCDQ